MNKNKRTNILKIGILFFGIFLLLWNCEKYENSHDHQEHQIAKIDYLDIEKLPEIESALSGLTNLGSSQNKSKSSRSMQTNFGSLNLTNILEYANNDGKLTYSFTIDKEFSSNNSLAFENLHLVKLEDGYLGYILKWESNEVWLENNNYNFILSDFTGTKTHYDLDYNVIQITEFVNGQSIDNSTANKTNAKTSMARDYYLSCTTEVVPLCNDTGSSYCGGIICGFGTMEVCSLVGSSGGIGGLDSLWGGVGTSVPRGSGSSGGITEDGSAVVVPVIPTRYEMEVNSFFNSLTQQQKDWLNTPFNQTKNQIINFFEDNPTFRTRDYDGPLIDNNLKEFAKEAVNALVNGEYVNFGEVYIETNTPDDNYIYSGITQLISNPIILSNGNQISITFGVTGSDNQNSNKLVSVDLVDGIKFALEQANNNLSLSNKITNIHIAATTNGQHSPTSNHTNGTAIDISRINGKKMAITGITDQIIELQKALDNFQYVRENFGPHFKHKYYKNTNTWNYNYPVGGHRDHIHFSVRL